MNNRMKPSDYKAYLRKHPRCTDPKQPGYARYRRALERAIALGTPTVVDDAERRLTLLDRAVNGYDKPKSYLLGQTPEPNRHDGPHIHGQQCKPTYIYRFPDTDSRALRVDEKRNRK